MKLKDFLKLFNVTPPYYLRVLHRGVGSKYFIDHDCLDEKELWMNSDVISLGVSHHVYLGALLEVTIYVR